LDIRKIGTKRLFFSLVNTNDQLFLGMTAWKVASFLSSLPFFFFSVCYFGVVGAV
jgi:hypothetical protein